MKGQVFFFIYIFIAALDALAPAPLAEVITLSTPMTVLLGGKCVLKVECYESEI